jgi:NADP-dependent 3-hydroxy acid dehydrogenase YdfG
MRKKKMKSFKDKVAVITGAGSGMGRYLAVLLAKDGADVSVCDVNEETLNETVEMLRKYNVSVSSHLLDVSDKEAIEALPGKVIEQHGKVDMVFNNAGVTTGTHFKDMDENNWDWVMGINFDGVINSTRAFIPHMVDSPEAAIVNTSSIFGMVAVPGQTVYHATKFAVRGFTESLAMEMKETNPNLQIHCVHPGHIGTNIAADARFDEENFNQDDTQVSNSIFTRNAPKSQKEMGDLFREGGMHPSKAAEIILNGVKKNKTRIFIGLDAKLLDLSQRIFPKHYHKTWALFMPLLMIFRDKKPLKSLD